MVGRGRTAAFMEAYHHEAGTNPYELEIALIDSLLPGEIPIFACSNPARVAPWGAVIDSRASARGSWRADGWLHARHQSHSRT